MVYCTKCGTKNEEGATICVNCQQPLVDNYRAMRRQRRKAEDDCFGLPNGGIIIGLIIGILIIFWGISSLIDIEFNLGPLLIIILGILIFVGALYRYTRRS
ncbi:MAG: zinc ribbon domain-containing protein [Candidatus Bathyarchaeota archaeon]